MKKILLVAMMSAAACAFAKDQYDIKPDAAKADEALSAVDWQNKNNTALDVATDEAVLKAFVADEAAAKALLAQVKPAYATDPMTAFQIAAVTQWVMLDDPWYCLLWDGEHAAGRKVWVKALCGTLRSATDDYVKMFCLDQLRWCGCPRCAECLAAFAAEERSKVVRDFAKWVVRELKAAE